ncbi:MAG: hypothetical protein M3128_00705, partial [Verrucomicrobiota bacterium]|nr:hypothetical protein [Verrucomicrobiota bacterium]
GSLVQVVQDKLPNVPKARVIYQLTVPDAPVEKNRPTEPVAKSPNPPNDKSADSKTARLAKNA